MGRAFKRQMVEAILDRAAARWPHAYGKAECTDELLAAYGHFFMAAVVAMSAGHRTFLMPTIDALSLVFDRAFIWEGETISIHPATSAVLDYQVGTKGFYELSGAYRHFRDELGLTDAEIADGLLGPQPFVAEVAADGEAEVERLARELERLARR